MERYEDAVPNQQRPVMKARPHFHNVLKTIMLVARREALLQGVGLGIAKEFGVQYRVAAIDLSQEGFIGKLAEATRDLDVGLVVSNAGTLNLGEFLNLDRRLLLETLRLNRGNLKHQDLTKSSHRFASLYVSFSG